MPFTAPQIAAASKTALDYHLRNKPIDQVGHDLPLLKLLQSIKKTFPGGKQYVTEQLRIARNSSFQWYRGDDTVTYNTRNPVEQAQFEWGGWHDGFSMDEDELLQNGIILTDDGSAKASEAEKIQLANLLEEKVFALEQGAKESFDYQLHLDGTQNAEAVPGLDLLISTTPAVGTVGGINRATATYWRNNVATGLATSAMVGAMEAMLRACRKYGGFQGIILAGTSFIDAYRAQAKDEIARHVVVNGGSTAKLDAGVEELYFRGVPIVWDPTFDDLDAALNPTIDWAKRAYFINKNTMKLRPADGHDMIARNPPRVYNQYVHYQGLTWKGALTINRPNGNGVVAIA